MKNYLLTVVVLLFCILTVLVGTYGLFESFSTAMVDANLANFNITIGNNIINSSSTNFVVTNFNINSSNHVTPGFFAPGSEASFEVNFNVTGTQVALKYDISMDFSAINNPQIMVYKIEELNGADIYQVGDYDYSGILSLSDIESMPNRDFKVTIKWIDNEENSDNDYVTGKNANSALIIPINMHFIQYTSEENKQILLDKLDHIISSSNRWGLFNLDVDNNSATITINDLISPVNYLMAIEKDNDDHLTVINNITNTYLNNLNIDVSLDGSNIVSCIKKDANNKALLDEDDEFSKYNENGVYCE